MIDIVLSKKKKNKELSGSFFRELIMYWDPRKIIEKQMNKYTQTTIHEIAKKNPSAREKYAMGRGE